MDLRESSSPLTPAKHAAAPVAIEDDFLANKPKTDESPESMEDDVPAELEAEESPAGNESEENVVKEVPGAFAPFSYRKYEPQTDEDLAIDGLKFANEDERTNLMLYIKEYHETEGFEIEHFTNKLMDCLLPLPLDQDEHDCTVFRDCKPTVEAAIDYFNQKEGSNLVLEKIVRCNYIIGSVYFATFVTKDTSTGATRTYQAQLARSHFYRKTTILRFRPKPDTVEIVTT